MTSIAWAIIIYIVTNDKSLNAAPENVKDFAYGLATLGLFFIVILTIKDILK